MYNVLNVKIYISLYAKFCCFYRRSYIKTSLINYQNVNNIKQLQLVNRHNIKQTFSPF